MRWAPLLFLLASFGCGGEKEGRVDPAAGHALLAEYVETVQSMARGGALADLGPLLDQQLEKARRLEKDGKLPGEVLRRHRRLVEVTRAVITPSAGPAEQEKVREFLDAVEGKKEHPLSGGMAEIAPALVEEVLSLHMLLDKTSDREKTRAQYLGVLDR
jgi:hypothetical protein